MLYIGYMKIVLTGVKVFFAGLKRVFLKVEASDFVKNTLKQQEKLSILPFCSRKYFCFIKSRGFSLIELLTTIGIIATVSIVAVISYNRIVKNAYLMAGKEDMSEVRKVLQYMYSVDGAYHPKIYSAGYRMKTNHKSFSGFPSATVPSTIKCTIFPRDSTELAQKHSRYFTLHKNSYDTKSLYAQGNSHSICRLTAGCDRHGLSYPEIYDVFSKTLTNNCSMDLSTINSPEKISAFCETYLYGVRILNPFGERTVLFTNEKGVICMFEENGEGIDIKM